MDRIEGIMAYAKERDEEKIRKEAEKARRIEVLKKHIRTLKPRMDELIKVGNACEENGVPLTGKSFGGHEGYDTHQFYTNSWSHLLGFVKEFDPETREELPIRKLGIFGGGACDYNLVTDGVTISVEKNALRVLERFAKEFDEFEEEFFKYVDKLTKRPEDEPAAPMSKKGNMAYWDAIDGIAIDCVSAIAEESTKTVKVDRFDLTDISKEVVELVTNRLTEDFGCEFPYVDESY